MPFASSHSLLPAFFFRDYRSSDYLPEVGLVIAGGGQQQKSAEISRDNGVTFEPLPNLPRTSPESCLVIVDNTAFQTGGSWGKTPTSNPIGVCCL